MNEKRSPRKGKGWRWFWIGAIFYAALFLGVIAYGMQALWSYLEAYEASRPYVAVEAYMAQLTKEHIGEYADTLIAQVDHNIQSEEECLQVVLDALDGELTYARNAAECTDSTESYVLYCGDQQIGSFTIKTGDTDAYGFAPWQFAQEQFDLSYLLKEVSLTAVAPEGYPVYVNGVALDESYIVDSRSMDYGLFAEFYDEYQLPVFTLVTYQVSGVFFSEFTISVTDPSGAPFVYDPEMEIDSFADNCTEEEIEALETFIATFLQKYVVFAGSANRDVEANYQDLITLVVSGSDLADRLKGALDGLSYAQSKGDAIESITGNHYVNIGDGKYLCDITYVVNTTGHDGVVQSTLSVKLIVTQTESGLLAEEMISY